MFDYAHSNVTVLGGYMEELYVGNLMIDEENYLFYFVDYKLLILGNFTQKINYSKIINFLGEDWWISVQDFENAGLDIKIDNIDYVIANKCSLSVEAYFITRSLKKEKEVLDRLHFRNICIRNDIIDYMFRNNREYIKNVIYLLNKWNGCGLDIPNPQFQYEPIDIQVNGENYVLEFKILFQGSQKPFPFNINHSILISSDVDRTFKEIWYVVKLVRFFLKFVAQSEGVNFEEKIYVYQDDMDQCSTFLSLRDENNADIIMERVLEYNDIKKGIGELINKIDNNKILFRSLFTMNKNIIFSSDIMNICAAFESQAPDFADKKKKDVRRKMVSKLSEVRNEFEESELQYFDEIIEGFNNYKDTLKERIECALKELVDIYGAEDIRYKFLMDYEEMPKRIKNSRNALDHGNGDVKLSNKVYWDAELLRAIVYMIILKDIGVENGDIKHSLDKLSRFP